MNLLFKETHLSFTLTEWIKRRSSILEVLSSNPRVGGSIPIWVNTKFNIKSLICDRRLCESLSFTSSDCPYGWLMKWGLVIRISSSKLIATVQQQQLIRSSVFPLYLAGDAVVSRRQPSEVRDGGVRWECRRLAACARIEGWKIWSSIFIYPISVSWIWWCWWH